MAGRDYLWTIIATFEGEDYASAVAREAEIHRFHPTNRQEFSVDSLAGTGASIRHYLNYARRALPDPGWDTPYLSGEKLSDQTGLRVLRHTESDWNVPAGFHDALSDESLDRYDYLARRSVFTDESSSTTNVNLKPATNPCYPDVDLDVSGSTMITCTEVKTTRTVDDYLNPTLEKTFFDDPVDSQEKRYQVTTKYRQDLPDVTNDDVEADWLLSLPVEKTIWSSDSTREARKTGWTWRNISAAESHAHDVIDQMIEHPGGTMESPTCTADCVEHIFHYDDLGNQVDETFRGGSGESFGSLVVTKHTAYLYGVPAWQAMGSLSCTDAADPDNCSFTMKLGLWQRYIDPGTGLPRLEIDGSGVGRAYLWDGSRRLTDIIPIRGTNTDRSSPWGRIAWTFDLETIPETGEVMKGVHIKYDEAAGSSLLKRSLYDATWASSAVSGEFTAGSFEANEPRASYEFDGLGRLSREKEWLSSDGSAITYRSKYHLNFLPGTSAPCSSLGTIPEGVARLGLESEWVEGTTAPACPSEGSWTKWTMDELDSLGHSLLTRLPDGSESTRSYYGDSRVVSSRKIADGIDSGGDAIMNSYSTTATSDALGRLRILEEQVDQVTSYRTEYPYDEMKRLTGVRLFKGDASSAVQERTYTYSAGGFLTRTNEPERKVDFFRYDALGNLLQWQTDGSSEVFKSSYDAFGRFESTCKVPDALTSCQEDDVLSKQIWGDTTAGGSAAISDPSYNRIVESTYHNRFGIDDVPVTERFDYNGPAGKISGKRLEIGHFGGSGDGFQLNFAYDAWGNQARVYFPYFAGCRYSDWESLGRTFDGQWLNSIALTSTPQAASPDKTVATFDYHPSGRVARESYLDGVSHWDETADPSGMARPGKIELTILSGKTPVPGLGEMKYDGTGNVWKIGDWRFAYDGLSRLTTHLRDGDPVAGWTNWGSYEYDRWGNLTRIERFDPAKSTSTLVFNLAEDAHHIPTTNRMDSVTASSASTSALPVDVALSWDDRGNLKEQAAGGPLRHKQYQWSGDDRLKQSTDSPGKTETIWRYAYDVAGERVLKWGDPGSGLEATAFIRDESGRTISEWNLLSGGSGFDVHRDYLYGAGREIAELQQGTTRDKLLLVGIDHLGSTRATFDDTGQSDNQHFPDYYPFGKLRDEADAKTTHLFTGHERDMGAGSSGLDYMHQRYYSTVLARFVSVDPVAGDLGSSQSWNRYSYVENNPTGFLDPNGETKKASFVTTGKAFDLFQHSAIRIYDDEEVGSSTDIVYSHGGVRTGSMPLLEYLAGYDPNIDPSTEFSLNLDESEIAALEGLLQKQYKRGIDQERYDWDTNNCAQSAGNSIFTAASDAFESADDLLKSTFSVNTTQGLLGTLKRFGLISGQGQSLDELRTKMDPADTNLWLESKKEEMRQHRQSNN